MLRNIQALVKNSANLDPAIVPGSIEQEVARVTDPSRGARHEVSAVEKMVGSCSRRDLRTGVAAGPLGILGHVEDGLDQERLIP